jgi:predicted dienelactone hydrolase
VEYDPFVRGSFPVGVRSGDIVDAGRGDRRLSFEVWYPAAPQYAALDLVTWTQDSFTVVPGTPSLRQAAVRDAEARPDKYPLVLFSHPSGGHRRQSSFLCTHLASHGYVVAAVDHAGNTANDIVDRAGRLARGEVLTQEQRDLVVAQLIANRVPDLRLMLDESLLGAGDVSDLIDRDSIGLIGWSFGGWTVLAAPEVDNRIGAVVALAPAGSSQPVPGVLPLTLTFDWQREVPTLFLVGESDLLTPLSGMYELFERTPSARQMFILREAGHLHFGDEIDEYDLCPRQHAHFFTRGLALAHLDAALKRNRDAERFMEKDAAAFMQSRGVDAVAYMDGGDI